RSLRQFFAQGCDDRKIHFHRSEMRIGLSSFLILLGTFFIACSGNAQRLMENLGRGLVAVHQGEGKVFLSWRLLGTEPDETAFNIYCTRGNGAPMKLNKEPL